LCDWKVFDAKAGEGCTPPVGFSGVGGGIDDEVLVAGAKLLRIAFVLKPPSSVSLPPSSSWKLLVPRDGPPLNDRSTLPVYDGCRANGEAT